MSDEWKSNIATHGHVLKYHTIIIDCSPVLFVDATGVEMLYQVCVCVCVCVRACVRACV